jgi:hypothetical protein
MGARFENKVALITGAGRLLKSALRLRTHGLKLNRWKTGQPATKNYCMEPRYLKSSLHLRSDSNENYRSDPSRAGNSVAKSNLRQG